MHIEKELELTKKALKVIYQNRFAVMIHTKSDLVLRNLELLKKIKINKRQCFFAITTCDDDLPREIEPNSSITSKRFAAIKELSDAAITTGIAIWPVLPFLTDSAQNIKSLLKMAHEAGCKYTTISYGVTLRGNQEEYFYHKLNRIDPELIKKYKRIYQGKYYCVSLNKSKLKSVYIQDCNWYNMAMSVPYYRFSVDKQLRLF